MGKLALVILLASFIILFPVNAVTWSRFNTSQDMINAVNITAAYQFTARNASQVYNASYDTATTEKDPLWYANYTAMNSTWNTTFNATYDAIAAGVEADPLWWANYTAMNSTWNSTYNASYESTFNATYDTNVAVESDPLWWANYTAMNSTWNSTYNNSYIELTNATVAGLVNNASYLSTYNASYEPTYNVSYESTYNSSYLENTGGTVNGNLVVNGNLTVIQNTTLANVTMQNVNGSVLPGMDNLFELGSFNVKWNKLWAANIYNKTEIDAFSFINSTYNATYDAKPSNVYNATYESTYNSTYDAKPSNNYNSSYEYWLNYTIMQMYNATYEYQLNATLMSTYNATYDAGVSSEKDPLWYANYTAMNSTWNTTYNSSYIEKTNSTIAGLVNNATYLSKYNSSYEYWLNYTIMQMYNATYEYQTNYTLMSTYNSSYMTSTYNSSYIEKTNATIAGLVNNASYLTTYNTSYDTALTEKDPLWWANYTAMNSTWNSTYNNSYIELTNATVAGLVNNASYLSTYNVTYDTAGTEKDALWYANYTAMNSTWNTTYNSTYNTLVNNASYLSTYNSSYVEKAGDTITGILTMYSSTPQIVFNDTNEPTNKWVVESNDGPEFRIRRMEGLLGDFQSYTNFDIKNGLCAIGSNLISDPTEALTVKGNFSVDTNVLFVNDGTNKVGVGTTNPQQTFDVVGTGNFTGGINTTSLCIGATCRSVWYTFNATYDALSAFVEKDPLWYANYTAMNSTWNSTYNSSYIEKTNSTIAGLVNNVSYLSTFNASYWTNVTNTSYIEKVNSTIAGLVNNVSYLSTYNASYWTNVTNASYIVNTNATIAGLVNNVSYLSTYNATYQAQLNHNTTAEVQAVVNTTTYGTFNSTVGGRFYLPNATMCWNPVCTVNMTFNGTNMILYG